MFRRGGLGGGEISQRLGHERFHYRSLQLPDVLSVLLQYVSGRSCRPCDHGGGEHFCRFNNAYKINHGHAGNVKLDGAKFWVAGDLGSDFSTGKMDWAVLTFDSAVTPEQREAIKTILGHVYPVKWNSFAVANDSSMEWNAGKEKAEARLDGGKTAEVVLKKFPGMTSEPVVMKNLKYWGVPRNDGFVMMPNEVQAYRAGEKPFEFKGTNGFMITLDINSRDVEAKDAKAKM
jgi:uncharacterized protein DUF1326